MNAHDLIFNRSGRLRSGWRLAIFILAYLIATLLLTGALRLALRITSVAAGRAFLESVWGWVAQALILFTSAVAVGWSCGFAFEGLPLRALGWARHRGWWRDSLMGTLFGAASLLLATAIATASGGFVFTFAASGIALAATLKTLAASCLIFIVAAAAEEITFRGYPLQTLLRTWPVWLALVPSSLLFAFIHLDNPNVVRGFTLVNTTLAGVWLAVAYVRTRSLWFPLGIHWSWNWTMGAILGLPVSGIEKLTPHPLLRAIDLGPAWLTGGAYGIEGGAACTIALALSTFFIWRTRLIYATQEMRQWTDGENPKPATQSVSLNQHSTDTIEPRDRTPLSEP